MKTIKKLGTFTLTSMFMVGLLSSSVLAEEPASSVNTRSMWVDNFFFNPNYYASAVKAEYTVKFVSDGVVLSLQKITSNNPAARPEDPVKTGYTFDGWDKAFNKITDNLTVTAKWKANKIALSFNANGGKVESKSTKQLKFDYGKKLVLPKNPTRDKYKFEGWYTKKTAGTKITEKTKIPSSDTTYYARWKKK